MTAAIVATFYTYYSYDKHKTILQVDTIYLGGHGQACPNYQK